MNINRYINFERLLTLNYKKIGLSDDEFVLLLITYELVQTGTVFVNPLDLAFLCNFTPTKIDVIYSGLIAKKYIENQFDNNNTMYTSFDGIIKRLLVCVENQDTLNNKEKLKETDLFKYMQKFFSRPLSPLEYDVIQGWKNKKYDFELIKAACELAMQNNNKSIRYIDTIIFEETKKKELGPEEYQKSQQETIELSKVDWLNK